MKKVYHLLSVALLGAMALTSCEEDKIVNENNGEGNETDKNLTDYSFIASIKQSAPLGRSNLQNGVYTWNKGDAVTLWNRNFGAGYDFSITPGYNDNQPDKSAEFTGKAAVENGHKLIAVFPRKEAKTFNDLATFSMPETFTQTGKTAELAATTYMVATGDVTDNKIPALTFSPLTALIQFGLKNTSDRELKIRYITLESDDDVFPAELKIDEDGVLQSLSGMRNKLTLDMSGQALAQNETLNGYLNILPTTYGDTRLMKSTTELNITVSVLNNEVEQDIILLKKVKVKDLEDNIGLDMDATANQFAAGKHYKHEPLARDRVLIGLACTVRACRENDRLKPRMLRRQQHEPLTYHARCTNDTDFILLHTFSLHFYQSLGLIVPAQYTIITDDAGKCARYRVLDTRTYVHALEHVHHSICSFGCQCESCTVSEELRGDFC